MNDYRVHHAHSDDMNEGWIWVKDESLIETVRGRRSIAKVEYGDRHIYCEIMYADQADIERFDDYLTNANVRNETSTQNLIFVNTWYSTLLGMPKLPGSLRVRIRPSHSLYAYCVSCFQHPQVVVVLGMVLGFIGAGLGVVGVGLGFIGIGLSSTAYRTFWLAVGIAWIFMGSLICVVGVWPLVTRTRRRVRSLDAA